MKKKILLIATMMMLFAFVLSISVLADAYDPNRTTIEYDGQSVRVITSNATVEEVASILGNNATMQGLFKDDDALVVLSDTNGSLFAFPTWYIIEPSGTDTSYVAISEVEYTFVNTLVEGSTFEKGAIRYIEFPHGMTSVRQNGVFGKDDGTGYEGNVTDVHIPNTVVSFDTNNNKNQAFKGNKSLKRVYIELGNTIKQIPSGTFTDSTIEYLQFENLTELESIDGFGNTALNCDIDLSNSKLKTIASTAFSVSRGIGKITLPDTVETIGDGAFADIGNGYLASPYLPASLTSIGKRFFALNNNLLDTYIFPVGVKGLAEEPFQDSKVGGGPSGKKLNLIFLGEVTGVVYVNGGGHQKHADEVTVYFAQNSLDQYNTNGFYIKPSNSSTTSVPGAIRVAFCKGIGAGTNGNVTGVEYVYITNTAGTSYTSDMVNDATNGFDFDNHTHYGTLTRVENNCADNGSETISCIVCDRDIVTVLEATGEHNYVEGQCTVCGGFYCTSGGEHILKAEAVYANGFASAGIVVNKCQSEGCTYEEKARDIEALFTCLGYSTNADSTGIATGFNINHDALLEYEEISGKKLTFGVIMFNPKYLAEDSIFTSDGEINASKGALQVELNLAYTHCKLSVSGMSLDNADHASLELVFAGYAYAGDDASTIQVFQKEYVGTAESPVSSPMASKVTRGENVLYTIKLQSVIAPAQITTSKEDLLEF